MKQHRNTDRGQVLIIFVFAAIALIGITGLAIDGSNIYADRRHAQNAADTAALAGALTKVKQVQAGATGCDDLSGASVCGAMVLNAALDLASRNGYTGNITDNTVEVHVPPIEGPYADCGSVAFKCTDYIQVIISTNVNTWFAKVLGIGQLHNRVQAVAEAKFRPAGSLYNGSALVALDPGIACSSAGNFYAGGSSTLKLVGSGIFINADCPYAFKEESGCIDMSFYDKDGNLLYPTYDANHNIIDPGVIQGVPGAGMHNASCINAPTLLTDGQQQQFPPDEPFGEPAECYKAPAASWRDGSNFTHFYPGLYTDAQFPPGNGDAVLEANPDGTPGVFCVQGLVKINNPKTDVVGSNIMIYIKPGGGFSLTGGDTNLSAPTSGPYKGFVIYVAPDYASGSPALCKFEGTASSSLSGIVWAPYCIVTMGGGSAPQGFQAQIIGYQFNIEGGANLMFTWDSSMAPTLPAIYRMGLYR